jgi:hypothetical protein
LRWWRAFHCISSSHRLLSETIGVVRVLT